MTREIGGPGGFWRRLTMHRQASLRTARSPPRMEAGNKRPARQRPIAEKPVAFTAFGIRIRQRAWMTEEAARACRNPSLMQDNPATG